VGLPALGAPVEPSLDRGPDAPTARLAWAQYFSIAVEGSTGRSFPWAKARALMNYGQP